MVDFQIVPVPKSPGRKHILVGPNAEHWGTIHMESHGGRGNSYWFQQVGQGGPIIKRGSRPDRFVNITVYGDKAANRLRHGDDPPVKPVKERLHDTVRELLDTGKLRDPAIIKAEIAEQNRRFYEARERKEAFRKRAMEALGDLSVHGSLVAAVVEAMEWAQQQ